MRKVLHPYWRGINRNELEAALDSISDNHQLNLMTPILTLLARLSEALKHREDALKYYRQAVDCYECIRGDFQRSNQALTKVKQLSRHK
jgi:hypothetical protein